jgi:diguanylate cyclase (GGDEF)-like protein
MSQIIDYLGEITGFRDRESLDLALVAGLKEIVSSLSIGLYRPVGEPCDLRWRTCARQAADDLVATADPPWLELSTLPRSTDYPDRMRALAGEAVRTLRGATHVSVFPLKTDRGVVGVLEAETGAELSEVVRNTIGGVLHVYCNFQNALDYGERDTLTGLLNRKTFDQRFYRSVRTLEPAAEGSEAADAPRGARGWVGMIDVDFFKAVNDRYGHLIGDEVLLLLSRLMGSSLRAQDQLYRFGGEEFVAVIVCVDPNDAKEAFELLRRRAEEHTFPQVGRVTISIGFTEILPGDSASAALGRADRAVYHAKANGRNQVQNYERLVAEGHFEDAAEQAGEIELF